MPVTKTVLVSAGLLLLLMLIPGALAFTSEHTGIFQGSASGSAGVWLSSNLSGVSPPQSGSGNYPLGMNGLVYGDGTGNSSYASDVIQNGMSGNLTPALSGPVIAHGIVRNTSPGEAALTTSSPVPEITLKGPFVVIVVQVTTSPTTAPMSPPLPGFSGLPILMVLLGSAVSITFIASSFFVRHWLVHRHDTPV